MLGGPPFDVGPEPDLAHVQAGDGFGEPVGADELLDALAGQVAEEPGYLRGADEVLRTRTGSHLTNRVGACQCSGVVKRLAGR